MLFVPALNKAIFYHSRPRLRKLPQTKLLESFKVLRKSVSGRWIRNKELRDELVDRVRYDSIDFLLQDPLRQAIFLLAMSVLVLKAIVDREIG